MEWLQNDYKKLKQKSNEIKCNLFIEMNIKYKWMWYKMKMKMNIKIEIKMYFKTYINGNDKK